MKINLPPETRMRMAHVFIKSGIPQPSIAEGQYKQMSPKLQSMIDRLSDETDHKVKLKLVWGWIHNEHIQNFKEFEFIIAHLAK